MRKLEQWHHAPTGNDRGNAVAIVLMVLAVVSLVGVGLLSQSIIDFKFASSYKSHNTAFNLADGAATLALTRVAWTAAPLFDARAAPVPLRRYAGPQNVRQGGTPGGAALTDRGTYWPLMVFQGPITDPTRIAGWELGKDGRTLQSWTAQGSGRRMDAAAGTAADNTQVRQSQFRLPTETSVQIATHKLPPS